MDIFRLLVLGIISGKYIRAISCCCGRNDLSEYDYNQHAYLRWKQKGYEEKMGNILWTQESGFNVVPQISGQYPPAGCATIAMAQVMKYNEYPTFF